MMTKKTLSKSAKIKMLAALPLFLVLGLLVTNAQETSLIVITQVDPPPPPGN